MILLRFVVFWLLISMWLEVGGMIWLIIFRVVVLL